MIPIVDAALWIFTPALLWENLIVIPGFGSGRVSTKSFLTVLVEQGIVGLLLTRTMFGAVLMAVRSSPPLGRRFPLVVLATLREPLTLPIRNATS